MSSQPSRRHVCHCGKSFLRKEHLRRHQATHSGPAFTCLVCGRSFSRSDLLRRHAGIHGAAAAVPDSRRGKACDTCHANKTRCDGGPQCSLCAKRGVVCTYGRRDGNSPPRYTAPSPPHPPLSARASMSSAPRSPGAVDLDVSYANPPAAIDAAAELSSDSASEQDAFTTAAAVRSILRAVTSRSGKAPATAAPSSAVPKSWLTACVKSYFRSAHERWPILHAPSLDETTDDVGLIASMVMINSWLHHERALKEIIMEIHDKLVEQSFADLANDSFDPSRPWPIETYQVALLNIVFAFESGRDTSSKRSRRLLSLLVSALRQHSCFNVDALERENNTHFPGDFVPWVYANMERWKRLAISTFQIDAYLSILYNQPPLMRQEELNLGLTSTFAMWNAYGLHIFFPRHRGEPWQRGVYKMSCLDMMSQQSLPSGILVEDIQLCLLGVWNDIWALQQPLRNRNEAAALKVIALERQLKVCAVQLDALENALQRPELHGQYTDFLLRAYSGKGLPSEPKWRERVLDRVHGVALTARMLYHLLLVHLHADVETVKEVAQFTPSPATVPAAAAAATTTTPTWQRKAMQIQEWAISADSRAAILHAMLAWRCYQEAKPALSRRRQPLDPILHVALSAAAMVLWAWTMHAVDACICSPERSKLDMGAVPLGAELPAALDEWVLRGGSSLALNGLAVCKCNAATWLTRFAEVLAKGGERWEMGSIAANVCLSKLGFS